MLGLDFKLASFVLVSNLLTLAVPVFAEEPRSSLANHAARVQAVEKELAEKPNRNVPYSHWREVNPDGNVYTVITHSEFDRFRVGKAAVLALIDYSRNAKIPVMNIRCCPDSSGMYDYVEPTVDGRTSFKLASQGAIPVRLSRAEHILTMGGNLTACHESTMQSLILNFQGPKELHIYLLSPGIFGGLGGFGFPKNAERKAMLKAFETNGTPLPKEKIEKFMAAKTTQELDAVADFNTFDSFGYTQLDRILDQVESDEEGAKLIADVVKGYGDDLRERRKLFQTEEWNLPPILNSTREPHVTGYEGTVPMYVQGPSREIAPLCRMSISEKNLDVKIDVVFNTATVNVQKGTAKAKGRIIFHVIHPPADQRGDLKAWLQKTLPSSKFESE